jgi:ABC-2 type transport system ATP-binding protein
MSQPGKPILEVENLVRQFGSRRAVGGVSFTVATGESVGLLGPNGAGKTTTLSIICGLLRPTSGNVRILGRSIGADDDPAKARFGLVPQELALMEALSARDNLALCGALYRMRGDRLSLAIQSALEFVGLADRATDRVSTFSGGMKRRINLAAALLHDPEILFLDEPTVGVDPQSRNAIFENVEELRRRGKTVVYTTHYMEEVERLCDRVIILDHGLVVSDDSLKTLKSKVTSGFELRFEVDSSEPRDLSSLTGLAGVRQVSWTGSELRVEVDSMEDGLERVLAELRRAGIHFHHLDSRRPSLENIFLQLTGRNLRDG